MRKVEELTKEELIQIVQAVQEILYLDDKYSEGVGRSWNPNKEWDSDSLGYIASYLNNYNLAPTEPEEYREDRR